MLRFRNRFTAKPSSTRVCGCGRRVMHEVSDDRETLIHELPWCETFEALVRRIDADPSVSLHTGLGRLEVSDAGEVTDARLVIIADGDTPADVTGRGES